MAKRQNKLTYSIYMHTTPSGKVYIGKTKRTPNARWANGKGYVSNPYFNNAILKYGWDNIKHEILETGLSEQEAYQSEIDYIFLYQATDPKYGYNITEGGDGGYGTKRDPETIKKVAKLASEKNKNRFVGSKSPRAKRVVQYTKDGQYIKTWGATTEAARELNINYTNIVKCCAKSQKSCAGSLWFYEGEDTAEAIAKSVEWASYIHFAPDQNEKRLKALREHYARLRELKRGET